MRILLVEDDESLGEGIRTALRRAAFSVDWLRDGASALAAIKDGGIDLVVLDLGLPHMDGMEVIRQARRTGADLPILVLSARERASDRTLGLDAGADDYLGKPFDTQELLARVRALLRRSEPGSGPPLSYAGLTLTPATRAVARGERPIALSPREFELLSYLMRHPRQVLPRERILEAVWGVDGSDEALDVYIGYLRAKLEAGGEPRLIQTVRGVGYQLRESAT